MPRHEREKSPQNNRGWTKERKVNAPIIIEELMVKELPLSLDNSGMRKLSVHTDPANEDSTHIKKNSHFGPPKNLLEVLRTMLVITQGLTVNNITMGPNQYRFTRTFLDGEVLRIFDLKLTELRCKTVSNLILVMDHAVTYFGPKECLSKQKLYIR